MSDSIDLILYENLRKRIINNEDLSEKEWDLFFYIEEKTKGIRIKNNEWSKIFLNSSYSPETQIKPRQKQELEELKDEYILKNAEEIIDHSTDIIIPQQAETKTKPFTSNFFNNRQFVFAISTGVVILFTTIFLLSNREKFYTGDLTKNEISGAYSSVNKSNNISSKEKSDNQIINQNDKLIAENSTNEPNEENNVDNAESYVINNFLEESIAANYRGADTFIKMSNPLPSAVFKINTVKVIVFSGEVISKSGSISSAILKIFDNIEKNYIDDNPLIKKEISIRNNGNEKEVFSSRVSFNKKPGVYYYTFEDREGNLLHAGKFIIKG